MESFGGNDGNKDDGFTLTPMQRAERIRLFLAERDAPAAEEGDAQRKLSSDATLAVIIMTDDMFRKRGDAGNPTWEHYAVTCGICACLTDAIIQFTNLPREAMPAMLPDAIHFLFSGPERKDWPAPELTYTFALTQYKHMMGQPNLRDAVDKLGGQFYEYLAVGGDACLAAMQDQFNLLMANPDLPVELKDVTDA